MRVPPTKTVRRIHKHQEKRTSIERTAWGIGGSVKCGVFFGVDDSPSVFYFLSDFLNHSCGEFIRAKDQGAID
jgi:hypothetical protein